jgi:hypothetical protein
MSAVSSFKFQVSSFVSAENEISQLATRCGRGASANFKSGQGAVRAH